MNGSANSNHGPTHVCPQCGEWFEADREGPDLWYVSYYDGDGGLSGQVWAEAVDRPICPADAATLDLFLVTLG